MNCPCPSGLATVLGSVGLYIAVSEGGREDMALKTGRVHCTRRGVTTNPLEGIARASIVAETRDAIVGLIIPCRLRCSYVIPIGAEEPSRGRRPGDDRVNATSPR